MKNDLKIQYVLPQNDLPQEYHMLINSMFHDTIGPLGLSDTPDVVVVDGFHELMQPECDLDTEIRYVLRTTVFDFLENYGYLKKLFASNISINVVFTDVENFTDEKVERYQAVLKDLGASLKDFIMNGCNINTNLLTDRIALEEMNNCGAGDTSVTLAPNGKFYPCPAFYYSAMPYGEIGNIESGFGKFNQELYSIGHSPLCRRCDAYHCKRCVWLNKIMTYEVNVPSRQQCLMAHVERNASMELLEEFHKLGILKDKNIEPISYLDPFDAFQTI
ncbi:MAG: CXXX repeat peptide maturase [Prevotella sp.]|nr:CXXX repeat peptide maturase [Prevotella sp.]